MCPGFCDRLCGSYVRRVYGGRVYPMVEWGGGRGEKRRCFPSDSPATKGKAQRGAYLSQSKCESVPPGGGRGRQPMGTVNYFRAFPKNRLLRMREHHADLGGEILGKAAKAAS